MRIAKSFALPSKIGISILSTSIMRLSISAPTTAAKICSTVFISAFPFLSPVLLSVENTLSISAFITGFSSRSVRINLIPVFASAGTSVIFVKTPV